MASVQFYKFYEAAPPIVRADKSALGTMPAAAFQYCEAMRDASSFGWHVFPPKDIHLLFDGKEAFYYEGGQWYPVKSANFEDAFREHWNAIAPPDLHGKDPPFLSELFVPGHVQIWSGYFIRTAPEWSTLIRPVVNYDMRSSFSCTEGLVETDEFFPLPLFINIRLLATDREIHIPAYKPLFQVQPIKRECYRSILSDWDTKSVDAQNRRAFPWDRYLDTVRDNALRSQHIPGRYAVSARKRSRE